MGCALSFLSNAGPYITERDLDDANDLVPPRLVRTDLPCVCFGPAKETDPGKQKRLPIELAVQVPH